MQDLEVNTMKGENETNWTQAVQMAMARITRVTHAQQTENTGRAAEMRRLSRTTEQFALWLVDLWDLVGILFIPVDVQVLAAPTHVESLHVMPWWHGFQQAGDGWAEFWVAGLQWEVRHRWAQWEACYGLLVVYRFLDQWTDSWHFWAKTPYKSPFFFNGQAPKRILRDWCLKFCITGNGRGMQEGYVCCIFLLYLPVAEWSGAYVLSYMALGFLFVALVGKQMQAAMSAMLLQTCYGSLAV